VLFHTLTGVATNDDKLETIKRDAKRVKEAEEIVVKVFRGAEPKKAKKNYKNYKKTSNYPA
jgi:hypothetical protein